MDITRRSLLFCAAAPAIVRVASLMPVSAWIAKPMFEDPFHVENGTFSVVLPQRADSEPGWATAQFEAVGAFLYSVRKP